MDARSGARSVIAQIMRSTPLGAATSRSIFFRPLLDACPRRRGLVQPLRIRCRGFSLSEVTPVADAVR
ncbi:hypothetical protein NI25_27645 [Streptomyces sp. CCM_MD2014]|nr:hypothetical protein NI25_27645 [Streptomyces sp. CCM_MD2014]